MYNMRAVLWLKQKITITITPTHLTIHGLYIYMTYIYSMNHYCNYSYFILLICIIIVTCCASGPWSKLLYKYAYNRERTLLSHTKEIDSLIIEALVAFLYMCVYNNTLECAKCSSGAQRAASAIIDAGVYSTQSNKVAVTHGLRHFCPLFNNTR